jgi:hypothetical protein
MSNGYFSFLLRIFKPGNSMTSPWRVTLQDTNSMQIHRFNDLQELDAFLRDLIGAATDNERSTPAGELQPGCPESKKVR